ncbi:MAG: hypothetical protein HY647_09125 [Acidobacteria bacterium]|nr:hypothetical protein [Acidobacteriota bacterium]
MKLRLILWVGLSGLLPFVGWQTLAFADKLELKDGTPVEGIVEKVEQGQVTIRVGQEKKVFDILSIASIDFDTPRTPPATSRLPWEHFLANMDAQEMVGHFLDVEQSAEEVRKLIDRTKEEWSDRKSIESSEVPEWDAAKERFRAPLSRYQEVLNDLYFHVLGKVDEYNQLMKETDALYVGVKGPFQVGSSLIPRETKKLPLKKYVPGNWYDTIFYEGYNIGYNDAFEKYSSSFHGSPSRE